MFEQARNGVTLKDYPVHLACRDGDVQSLTKYVGLGQDRSCLAEEDDFYHWTPLHFASFFGQLPALIVLREAGVGVDITTASFQQTAAHIAAFSGADHCLKYLVHFGCNVNKQDYLGETPLHKAARSGSVACGRVLVADGRAMSHLLNTSGQTPATLATACGRPEMAAFLAEYERSSTVQRRAEETSPPRCTQLGLSEHKGRSGQVISADQPALNGGLVPTGAAAADNPWCYQPPCRPADRPGHPDDCDAVMLDPGHRHQAGEPPHTVIQNGLLFSAGVGGRCGAGISNGWRSNGDLGSNDFGKRCREDVMCEDIKRRRLLDCAGGDRGQSVPLQLVTTAGSPLKPTDSWERDVQFLLR